MKNKIILNLILLAGICLTATAGVFEEAIRSSTERNLPIFAYFSASDWSVECMRFDSIVLQKPEFKTYASSNLIMLQIDYPRKQSLPEEIQKQNDELRKKYGISSYPTVLLLNSKGGVIATKNYDKGGVTEYIEELKKIIGK